MAPKRKHTSPFHRQLLLPALLGAAFWIGGATILERSVLTPYNTASITDAAEKKAQAAAAELNTALERENRQLHSLIPVAVSQRGSDAANSAAPAGDIATSGFRVAVQKTFAAGTPRRAQYFTRGELQVGAGSAPELNFALIDLIKRTLNEGPQPLEILPTAGGKDWQQHRVLISGEDAVLVSQPFLQLETLLAGLADSDGEWLLLQQFPAGPVQTLWRAGQGSGPSGQAAVPGSHLRLAFSPDGDFVKDHSIDRRWLFGLSLIGLLATLVALVKFMPRSTPAPWERQRPRSAGAKESRYVQLDPEPDFDDPAEPAYDYGYDHSPAATFEPMSITPPADMSLAPGIEPTTGDSPSPQEQMRDQLRSQVTADMDFPAGVFRAYDIRGYAETEINEPFAYQLGRALGTMARQAGEELLMVARDGRNSSALLSRCLVEGILDTGCNAVDLGLAPSPLLYFACARGNNTSSGVVVTASHNPAEYNGFKIVLKGHPLAEDELQKLRSLMKIGPFDSGQGSYREQDIREHYIEEIFHDVALAGQPRLVIDAGNGATANLAPQLFEGLGCVVTPLFCEVDGNFPNHSPDPSRPENLQALIDKVAESGADLGIALDGDGDRVTLVSSSGRIAWADQLVMLLARDILTRNPGETVVFDVKCSRALGELVKQYGGRPLMWKTGHAPMKSKMLETGAILGGELSGHIFIKDRWFGFDDGMYAAARILEIMALREQSLDALLDSLPQMFNTPEVLLPVPEQEKFALIQALKERGQFPAANVNSIDGLRVEFADGWGLIRASNTGAALTLRFEAETEQALQRIFNEMRGQLAAVAPQLSLPDL
ncbi:phosphoglucosamine mutase [Microbulbifer aestuariivivens]|uniref:phosphomannomutase n=1 Tax=Microbulbifer aestuariivivens TaxID=1908308 RepID=A0ABP9WRQ5_9GAMM